MTNEPTLVESLSIVLKPFAMYKGIDIHKVENKFHVLGKTATTLKQAFEIIDNSLQSIKKSIKK